MKSKIVRSYSWGHFWVVDVSVGQVDVDSTAQLGGCCPLKGLGDGWPTWSLLGRNLGAAVLGDQGQADNGECPEASEEGHGYNRTSLSADRPFRAVRTASLRSVNKLLKIWSAVLLLQQKTKHQLSNVLWLKGLWALVLAVSTCLIASFW